MSPTVPQTSPPETEDDWVRRVADWDDTTANVKIRQGISIALVVRLQELLDFTDEQTARLIGRSRSTYSRYRNQDTDLGVPEAERAVRYARLLALAAETFGSLHDAATWMQEPNPALDGETPLEMAETDPGATIVRDLLLGVQHGFVL
jgi:putative toxin-antitoxin system antitoxin component (TIGR02293 family)